MYFLEQLVAEWYAYKGFFVRTNIKFGKRPKGGWEGEIDVAAFDPRLKHLVHVEASSDANSWKERETRFLKKFADAKRHYVEVFDFEFKTVQKRAVVGFSRTGCARPDFGGDIEIVLVPEFIQGITSEMKKRAPAQAAVPEGSPLLRAIQFAVAYDEATG